MYYPEFLEGGLYEKYQMNMDSLNKIQDKLVNEESRKVFNFRLQASFDGIWHRYLDIDGPKRFTVHEFAGWYEGKNLPIVVYGTDGDGRYVMKFLRGQDYPVAAYCSFEPPKPSEEARYLDGVPVLSIDDLWKNRGKYVVFLASSRLTPMLYEQCIGWPYFFDRNLVFYPSTRRLVAFCENQYFDFFEPKKHEVFVDGGSWDGQTTVNFAHWAKKGYDMSYIFEANPKMKAWSKNDWRKTESERISSS